MTTNIIATADGINPFNFEETRATGRSRLQLNDAIYAAGAPITLAQLEANQAAANAALEAATVTQTESSMSARATAYMRNSWTDGDIASVLSVDVAYVADIRSLLADQPYGSGSRLPTAPDAADFPIKVNTAGSLAHGYYAPGDPNYGSVVPELLLDTVETAKVAGFAPAN